MILALDLGNSRLKWAVHPADLPVAGRFTASGSIAIESIDTIDAALAAIDGVREAVICSVADSQAGQAVERAIGRLGLPLHAVHARAECAGVRNLYAEPSRLGADRWAAVIGAHARAAQAALVVDAGTAMTVDALAADGRFLGGLIVAGFDLMRTALADGTARLPMDDGEYHPLARSTRDAITTGALQALAGAVMRTREAMIEDGHVAPRLLLTGGSAPRLAPVMQAYAPQCVPQLVLEGLVAIAIADRGPGHRRRGRAMIKWLLALLLIANVLFGALTRWGGSELNPDAQLLDLQMNAQQVRVIAGGQDQSEGQHAKAGQPAKVAVQSVACLAWGPFVEADAERAREALAALVPADRVVSREVAGKTSFWLQIPPLKSRADAQKKLAELKALGLTGFSLVDNDPQWTNAIDLGAFADDATARDQLARLQQAGVRSATVIERKGRGGVEWLVREPGEAITARVLELKQTRFPDSALGAIECPAPGRS